MSQAFVREGDDQSLGDIVPTMNALIQFLMRENNGVRVYECRSRQDGDGTVVHEMSNGLPDPKPRRVGAQAGVILKELMDDGRLCPCD